MYGKLLGGFSVVVLVLEVFVAAEEVIEILMDVFVMILAIV